MRRLLWPILVVLALLTYLILLDVHETRGQFLPGARTLSDHSDIEVYFARGSFYPRGLTPYVDVPSEYPMISTLLFAAPYLRVDPTWQDIRDHPDFRKLLADHQLPQARGTS